MSSGFPINAAGFASRPAGALAPALRLGFAVMNHGPPSWPAIVARRYLRMLKYRATA
jgi:hypothetical protein